MESQPVQTQPIPNNQPVVSPPIPSEQPIINQEQVPLPSPKSKFKAFLPVLLIVVVFALVIGGYFIIKIRSSKISNQSLNSTEATTTTPLSSPTTISPLATANEPYMSIFSGVSKVFSENLSLLVQITSSSNGTLYWPISNGAFASIVSSPEIQISNYCSTSDSSNDSATVSKIDTSLAKLDEYFLSTGFKNVSNPAFTNTKFSDAAPGIIIGYQNDTQGISCTLIFANTYFSCVDPPTAKLICNSKNNIDQTSSSQQSYLQAFGEPGETMDILGQYGNFYYFNLSSPIGPGAGLFAEKSSTGWIKIEGSQQEFITCSDANKYKVPHQLKGAEQCYDSTGNTVNNSN